MNGKKIMILLSAVVLGILTAIVFKSISLHDVSINKAPLCDILAVEAIRNNRLLFFILSGAIGGVLGVTLINIPLRLGEEKTLIRYTFLALFIYSLAFSICLSPPITLALFMFSIILSLAVFVCSAGISLVLNFILYVVSLFASFLG